MLGLKDHIINVRVDTEFAEEIGRISSAMKNSTSEASRHLLELGVEAHRLLRDEPMLDFETECIIGKLSRDKQVKLLEFLIERLGEDKVIEIRKDKAEKILLARALAKQEKDHIDPSDFKLRDIKDEIDLDKIAVPDLVQLAGIFEAKGRKVRKYLDILIERKLDADGKENSHERTKQLEKDAPDELLHVMRKQIDPRYAAMYKEEE